MTADDLDKAAECFSAAVTAAVINHTPRAKPSAYTKRWWTPELTVLRHSLTTLRNGLAARRQQGMNAAFLAKQYHQAETLYLARLTEQKRAH